MFLSPFLFSSFLSVGTALCTIHCYLAIFIVRGVMAYIFPRVHFSRSASSAYLSFLSMIIILVMFIKCRAHRRRGLCLDLGVLERNYGHCKCL